jgi:hypothetical protein
LGFYLLGRIAEEIVTGDSDGMRSGDGISSYGDLAIWGSGDLAIWSSDHLHDARNSQKVNSTFFFLSFFSFSVSSFAAALDLRFKPDRQMFRCLCA